MTFGNMNLGNIATALRMTGSDPSLLDEYGTEQPEPVTPASPAIDTEAVNQALAATGSSYRAEPVAPFNPAVSTRRLQQERLAGQNQMLDLKTAKGEIASEGADKAAAVASELETRRRDGLERASSRVDLNRSQKDDYERQARQRLDSMVAKIDNPPDNTKGKVLSIIGAVLSMTGGGKAVGAGLQMLGQAMSTDMQSWAQGIEGDEKIRRAMMDMAGSQNEDSESELRQEQGLSTLAVGVYDAALKKVAAETDSKEVKRAAEEMSLELRDKYLAHQIDIDSRQVAAKQQNVFWQMPLNQLAALNAQGGLSKAAQEVLSKRVKMDQESRKGEADIANTWADTSKKGGGTAGGPGGMVAGGRTVENPQIWNNIEPATKAKYEQGQIAADAALSALQKYKAYIEANGTESFGKGKSEVNALGNLAKLKVKEAGELGAWDNGTAQVLADTLGDPTAWTGDFGGIPAQVNVVMSQLRDEREMKARTLGLSSAPTSGEIQTRGTRKPASGTTAPAASPTSVSMVNPDTGHHIPNVARSKVAALEAMGYILGRPSDADTTPPYEEGAGTSSRRPLQDGGVGGLDY